MNEDPKLGELPAEELPLGPLPITIRWMTTLSVGLWTHIWEVLTEWVIPLIRKIWDGISAVGSDVADIAEEAAKRTTPEHTAFTRTMAETITDLRELPHPLDWFMILYTVFFGSGLYIKEKIRLALLPVGQDLNQSNQTEIAPLDAIVREWFRTPEDRTLFTELIQKHNLNPQAQRILLESIEQYPSIDMVYQLRNRKIIPDDKSAMWFLQKLGFSESGAETALNLRWVIPPLTDIIRIAVREGFSPEAIEAFDLEQHFPEELVPWAEAQGLSRDWAMKYWIAHWDLPSLQQGFEMMWRTDFSEEDLDLLMRFADVNPYFRPYLKQIAHRPYTRVDARRMADVGVLDPKQLKIAYKDIGFDEEHAVNMTDFTLKWNRRSELQDLVDEWIWMYMEGDAQEDEVLAEITLILDDPGRALLEVAKASARKAIRFRADQRGHIRTLYTSRRISENEASDKLDALQTDPQRKADFLEEWGELRKAKQRYPTKADLEKYLRSGAIEYMDWDVEMERLGYSRKYREWQIKYLMIEMKVGETIMADVLQQLAIRMILP